VIQGEGKERNQTLIFYAQATEYDRNKCFKKIIFRFGKRPQGLIPCVPTSQFIPEKR
jgi:hypothetical protein